ncbi:MAG TPA: TIGR02757 family protein [Cyclobacteriaceae bacterium]|nr:TIGR02757 family protein [Cyclobacteriaceae bacterium]HMV10603.1 TIGR02757 family protein [Cyclobacteriaceae bacterium]HMV89923.1 TIGR02757 family protein [Cyclobacteriaceae bacterium]HMX02590.1 TIGR02757 family protein [Cyclobacteriaceae bacterium]HMX50911.1 TIGR02757 family protein [Cyclobacteriaceae bacterium]
MARRIDPKELKEFLDEKVAKYNQPGFIADDPVSIPHRFTKKQDIEIAGLFAATLAWGQRKTIIRKCSELMDRMDNEPHAFVTNHSDNDLKPFLDFKHRTFNATDTLYFIEFLRSFYKKHKSLEDAFLVPSWDRTVENGLIAFHNIFFGLPDFPTRTKKHVATPARGSTCKRLVMYLRWMVRQDNNGVDFGIWKNISPSQLVCPCDLHVDRVARKLKLIKRKQTDWQTALELTDQLRKFDGNDPVKYDFALFGLGIEGWTNA